MERARDVRILTFSWTNVLKKGGKGIVTAMVPLSACTNEGAGLVVRTSGLSDGVTAALCTQHISPRNVN